MTISEKLNLRFKKSQCLKVILFRNNKQFTEHIVIPKNEIITIEDFTFKVNSENIFYNNNIGTLVFSVNNPLSANPLNWKSDTLTASEFNTAMENKIVEQIVKSSNDNSMESNIKLSMFCSIGALLVSGFVAYTMINEFTLLNESIINIKDTLNQLKPFL